jgi:hypothetical protein
MLIQRNIRGRQRTSYIDENCVVVESLIREDGRVKFRDAHELN